MACSLLSTSRCLIIAEVAQAHDGSLGMAHAYIDAVADSGADAVKFQTHFADSESSAQEPFRVKFSYQDATRYDFWKRMEFSDEQWLGLKQHCDERGLIFLSSPFSLRAVDLLERLGMCAWKIASGEISNFLMLDRIGETRRPVLVSCGMSDLAELEAAIERLRSKAPQLAIMQCTTSYPCPPEAVGLNLIAEFRERFGTFAGLSDHSGTIFPALAGAAIGMDVVEVHITFSRKMFGPDVPASVTLDELSTLVRGIRFIEAMRANPVDKTAVPAQIAPLREIFMKSLVAARDLPAGIALGRGDLDARKPLAGIPAQQYEQVVGRRTRRKLTAGTFINETDLC